MSTSHESFEELCALAAIGQISVAEFAKLQAHLDVCAACRGEYADYQSLIHDQLPLVAPPEPARKLTIAFSRKAREEGCRQRFIAEAKQRGFRFSSEAEQGPRFLNWLTKDWGSNHKLLLTIFALFAITIISGYRLRESEARRREVNTESARLASQNATLRQQLDALSQIAQSAASMFKPQPAPLANGTENHAAMDELSSSRAESENAASRAAIEAELNRMREEYAALGARAKTIEEQLQASVSQSETLKSELEASRNLEKQLTRNLQEAERAIKEMTVEVRSLREGRMQNALLIATQKSQLEDRAGQLREQDDALERQKTLLAADRDIRDIMTARNLHIIDVRDIDGKGQTRRPVGRIFYTENKSLVFYAFDLDDKRLLHSNYAFQAWGYRESNDLTARDLGIFYIDDQKQKRWALRFDDPGVLRQIDAVFVTIEPPGGSKKPTGQKLLYAYLKNKPNHP